MDALWKRAVWSQFGAAIDMLENTVLACPNELWGGRLHDQEFWYVVYHALFWLDLYLTGSVEGFAPPAPYGLEELDPAGLLPERVYTKSEMAAYLRHGREKCRATVEALTDETAGRRCRFTWGEMSFAELLLYNLRHVQDHAGGLHLILSRAAGSAPNWVTKARPKPSE